MTVDAWRQPVHDETGFTNPRWDYPEYPQGSVVELRVHGVGGEPPSGMSRDPQPRQVGGDDVSGFWRSRNPVISRIDVGSPGGRARATDGPRPAHVREVLSWGGQTSGSLRHALWVLLLPFALFNLAGRMHGDDPRSRRSVVVRAAARTLAYTMTLAVVLLISGVAIDLIGVQCARATACLDGPRTGQFLLAPVRFFADDAAGRLALLGLTPAVVILGLWWAGRYRTGEFEGVEDVDPRGMSDPTTTEPVRLHDPGFWRNDWSVSRLRATHASGAFALISAILSLVMLDVAPPEQHAAWRWALALSALGVAGGAVLVALPSMVRPGRHVGLHHAQWALRMVAIAPGTVAATLALVPTWDLPNGSAWAGRLVAITLAAWWFAGAAPPPSDSPDVRVVGNLKLVAAVGVLASTFPSAVAALDPGEGASIVTPTVGQLPAGLDGLPSWLLDLAPGLYVPVYLPLLPLVVVQLALLVVVAATSLERGLHVDRRPNASTLDPRAFPLNAGAVVVTLLALLLLTGIGGSLHALTLDWLGSRRADVAAAASPGAQLTLPWWHATTALVTAVVLPLMLLLAWATRSLVRGRGRWRVVRPSLEEVDRDLDRGLDDGVDGWGGLVDRADVPRARTPGAPARLEAIGRQWLTACHLRDATRVLAAAVLAGGVVAVAYVVWVVAAEDLAFDAVTGFPLVTVAVWSLAALLPAMVGLIRAGLSARATRRKVGGLWDVLTFWPRVTHPFAPPCYAEAVVPMLAQRIRRLTTHPKRFGVLLAGHSQGSVVAMAAVATGTAGPPDRLAMVSYGSPIAILYERTFAGVFGGADGSIAEATRHVGTWHHLFAMTEPFAYPLWGVEIPTSVPEEARRAGWGINRVVPHADDHCPVCGWIRVGLPLPTPGVSTTDYVVSDPDRWYQPLDPLTPRHKGHSTYHDHREVDLHLARIAETLGSTPPTVVRVDETTDPVTPGRTTGN